MSALNIRITGRVQGVWYRGWTCEKAIALGLTGWVRNRRDGSVEAVIAGPSETLETMIGKFRTGPPLAHVTDVQVAPCDDPGLAAFESRPTV